MATPTNRWTSNLLVPSGRTADAVALVAGLLLPLAFAPFDLYPLAPLALAALFHLWQRESPARAAWRGWLFGLGMFGVGVSWLYVSMNNFGNMPAPLAAFATLVLVALLALYPALLGFAQARWFRRERWTHAVLVLPALWVVFEWWRGWFLSGFPWLNLGYSQVDTPLAWYAPIAGVYGVSLVVALSAGLIAACLRLPTRAVALLGALAALWLGGFSLGGVQWADAEGPVLRATLVQGNVPLREKWNPQQRQRILNRYRQLSFSAPPSELIVWPEAAIPSTLHQVDPEWLDSLREFSRRHGTDFLIGAIERGDNRGDAGHDYYNSAIVIGREPGVYRKQHLVPFGEYVPFEPLFGWLMSSFEIPMSSLSPASAPQRPLSLAGRLAGVSVCYEDAFGEEVIRALPQASLLVNVSEDAWFGDSLAPHQRLQMARMRSLEAARPMLRAANTGPSAAIDHRGNVLTRSGQFRAALLYTETQPMRGRTPYGVTGNGSVLGLVVLLLVVAGFSSRRFR